MLDSIKDVHQVMLSTLDEIKRSSRTEVGPSTAVAVDQGQNNSSTSSSPARTFASYYWGARFHPVPEGFLLPDMNLNTLITYWYVGSQHPQIAPLKQLKLYNFALSKRNTMKATLSKMMKMMAGVERAAKHVGFDIGQKGELIDSVERATMLYEKVLPCFMFPTSGGHVRRYEEIVWRTVFDIYSKKYKYKFLGEE